MMPMMMIVVEMTMRRGPEVGEGCVMMPQRGDDGDGVGKDGMEVMAVIDPSCSSLFLLSRCSMSETGSRRAATTPRRVTAAPSCGSQTPRRRRSSCRRSSATSASSAASATSSRAGGRGYTTASSAANEAPRTGKSHRRKGTAALLSALSLSLSLSGGSSHVHIALQTPPTAHSYSAHIETPASYIL